MSDETTNETPQRPSLLEERLYAVIDAEPSLVCEELRLLLTSLAKYAVGMAKDIADLKRENENLRQTVASLELRVLGNFDSVFARIEALQAADAMRRKDIATVLERTEDRLSSVFERIGGVRFEAEHQAKELNRLLSGRIDAVDERIENHMNRRNAHT